MTLQWYLYTYFYIIGGLGLIDTIKGGPQTTETTAILWFLTIFKHWGLNVKLHFLHIFCISDLNFKHYRFICIFCFVMPMIDFPIETRFTCDNIFLNPIKINITPTMWSCRMTLELEFIFILIIFCFSDIQILSTKHDHFCIYYLFHRHSLYVIFDINQYIMIFI